MRSIEKPADILTFMIIGAQKAGTTWLYDMLAQHPDVFLPAAKELHFYNNRDQLAAGYEAYLANFSGAENYAAVGEATPNYLSLIFNPNERDYQNQTDDIPSVIASDLPDISLLVSLRNPIDRAISGFHHFHTRGKLPVNAKLRDCAETYGILNIGNYANDLQRWYQHYPEDRFCILIFEQDIIPKTAKRETIDRVCAHIGVNKLPESVDLNVKSNEKLEPAMAYLNRLPFVQTKWRAFQAAKGVSRRVPKQIQDMIEPKITQADRDFLAEIYAPQNEELERLLGIKLHWS